VLHLASNCRAYNPLLEFWFPKAIYTTASNFFWLWTWASHGWPDGIEFLGPEHCHQELHSREGSVFLRTR
jgi:hypothetical protein